MFFSLVERNRHRLVFIVVLVLAGGHAIAMARSRDLTESEARELAALALTPTARKLPALTLSLDNPLPRSPPTFYWFEATAAVPNASPILGHYAVNRVTGDVWDPVWCKKLSTPDLRKSQSTMRKRIGLGAKELRRLSSVAPCTR
jgi:hypothetical protein